MAKDVVDQLNRIASDVDFSRRSQELVDCWTSAGAGVETIEPILRFMESHSTIDYGTPGPLVHFLEGFYGAGYEAELISSVQRRPTPQTAWMLNRMINGTRIPEATKHFVAVMEQAIQNPLADRQTIALLRGFLEHQSRVGS